MSASQSPYPISYSYYRLAYFLVNQCKSSNNWPSKTLCKYPLVLKSGLLENPPSSRMSPMNENSIHSWFARMYSTINLICRLVFPTIKAPFLSLILPTIRLPRNLTGGQSRHSSLPVQALEPHHVAAAAARPARPSHRPHRLGGERRLAAGHGAAQPDAAGAACRGRWPFVGGLTVVMIWGVGWL